MRKRLRKQLINNIYIILLITFLLNFSYISYKNYSYCYEEYGLIRFLRGIPFEIIMSFVYGLIQTFFSLPVLLITNRLKIRNIFRILIAIIFACICIYVILMICFTTNYQF